MPRLAKVVNVLAIWQVKQGTETTGFRIGFTPVYKHHTNTIRLTIQNQAALTTCKYTSSERGFMLYC